MTVSVNTSGTTAALTIGTPVTLATITTAGIYVLVVDTVNMVTGDALEMRIYSKPTAAGDTERQAYCFAIQHGQADIQKISIPVPSPVSFRAELTQTAGTGRAFKWAVWSL